MASRLQLGPHFAIEEFDCHSGALVPGSAIDALTFLVRNTLEPLRSAFGAIHIDSGYRTPAQNGLVGGAIDSRHLYDAFPHTPAVDFHSDSSSTRDLLRWLSVRLSAAGLGYYTTHIHLDLRTQKARW